MKTTDKLIALKTFPLLDVLSDFQLERFANQSSLKSYKKGERVYENGDQINFVHFVYNGKVKLASIVSCGKTLIKDIIHKSDLFGENIFGENKNRSEYAEVLENGTMIFSIPKQVIMEGLVQNQQFSENIVHIIMTRMNNLEQRMQNFIFLKAKSRISEFLSRMANQRGIKIGFDELLINHGLSHKDIAYMTDTSRQTVARVLSELKQDNLIHFSARKPSKILVRDIHALQAV